MADELLTVEVVAKVEALSAGLKEGTADLRGFGAAVDAEVSKIEQRLSGLGTSVRKVFTDLNSAGSSTGSFMPGVPEQAAAVGDAVKQTTDQVKDFWQALDSARDTTNGLTGGLEGIALRSINLKTDLAAVNQEIKDLSKQFADPTSEEYKQRLVALTARQAELKAELGKTGIEMRAAAKDNISVTDSMDGLGVALGRARAAYRALSEADREGAIGKELQSDIAILDTRIKALDASIGNHQRNVGNYASGLDGLKDKLGGLINVQGKFGEYQQAATIGFQLAKDAVTNVSETYTQFTSSITAYREAQSAAKVVQEQATTIQNAAAEATQRATAIGFQFGQGLATQAEVTEAVTAASVLATEATEAQAAAQVAATAVTEAGTVALRAFRIAMISTGIGAVIVLLGSLVSYFASTQEGIDKVTRVLEPLKVAFNMLLGAAQNLGQSLVNAFTNPKQAMMDLGNFVKDQLINRFKALGVVLDGIVNFDFKKITNGALQFGTGVENVIDKTTKAVTHIKNLGNEIAKLKIQRDKESVTAELDAARQNRIAKEQAEIARDSTKSAGERARAAKAAIAAINEELRIKNNLINLDLKIDALEDSTFKQTNARDREDNKMLKQKEDNIAQAAQARVRLNAVLNKANQAPKGGGVSDVITGNLTKIAEAVKRNNDEIAKQNLSADDKEVESIRIKYENQRKLINDAARDALKQKKISSADVLKIQQTQSDALLETQSQEGQESVNLIKRIATKTAEEKKKADDKQAAADEKANNESLLKLAKYQEEVRQQQMDLLQASMDNPFAGARKQIEQDIAALQESYKTGLIDFKNFTEQYKQLSMDLMKAQVVEDLFNSLSSGLSSSFSALGETLASGGNIIQAMGAAFLQSFGSFLSEVGQMVIKKGAAMVLIGMAENAVLPGSGAKSMASGFTLMAAGAALSIGGGFVGGIAGNMGKDKSSKDGSSSQPQMGVPHFAGGVNNFVGGVALVGERGPELVNLPGGSDVIPNHKIMQGMNNGGSTQVFIPETRISGSDIVIAYKRAERNNSRG